MIRFKKGYKYQLESDWKWKLQEDIEINYAFQGPYYALTEDGWIHAFKGCAWDGATWFPDFDWIMEGSLGHDILHWLIAHGAIPESQNDLIDKELENIIRARHGNNWFQRRLDKFRGWYVRRATGFVDQKAGLFKPVITLPR